MKVSCLQEKLAKGLGIVGRAVAPRSTLPILGNIRLAASGTTLTLSATNLEMGIHCQIMAEVQEEGAITVPAKLLSDFVSELPSERIEMSRTAETETLHLACGRYTSNVKGLPADDFPAIPSAEGQVAAEMEAQLLRRMIDQVAIAAATDEDRPILAGCLFRLKDGNLALAAADGFRLSVCTSSQAHARDVEIVVPAKVLKEVRRAAVGKTVRIFVADNQINFQMDDVEVVSRLIEGQFPDYAPIVPQHSTVRSLVNRDAFLKAVRVARLFAPGEENSVRLDVTPNGGAAGMGRITIKAQKAEVGDNRGEVDAIIQGEEAAIAFNGKFLADALAVMSAENVSLELTTATSPGVLKPVSENGDTGLHVIMPMHLGGG